jgi:hypothetical protein
MAALDGSEHTTIPHPLRTILGPLGSAEDAHRKAIARMGPADWTLTTILLGHASAT